MFKKIFDKFKKKDQQIEQEIQEQEIEQEIEEQEIEEEIQEIEQEIQESKEDEVQPNEEEIIEEHEEEELKVDEISVDEYVEQDLEEVVEEKLEELKKEETKKEEIKEVEEVKEEVEEVKEEVEEVKEEVEEEESKVSLFSRLKDGLSKTKKGITDRVDQLLKSYVKIDEELFEDLEEILITSDVGVNTTMDIVEQLKDRVKSKKITDAIHVRDELKEILSDMLGDEQSNLNIEPSPAIILVVGVNGVGKTTTIGKMANRFKKEGKNVLLAAGDTFRAAAIDQLEVWADRVGVDIIKHSEGSDPGAVIFDAIAAAKSRKADVLICDTAGRLHNKKNLMNELGKVFKIVDREYPQASKEVLLVVDATTGQNAISQAKVFKEAANITGIVLTKLDGTAKGGVVLAVKSELNVPVKLIGVGEQMEDLQDFNSKDFVKALFGDEN
ncbi:signal recognition particle-docking protein FtsY [Tepidibacter hydrothermalis]|uniref:Signal recognition particle receptor FtsY n=1 Tax=Tepidibacter hydrothermalis TaxID=3036126 RepID=A0ABY8E7V1_9FIRM|nr:signal recognition particle-docking protein FtsY [Tepidibacter hydrothermalis]WFD08973.1 signal recognition particle-docking protein FtsY [Tepidibacter hydrothermalis]